MSISKTYGFHEVEDKWYSYWMQQGFFRSVPDEREPYTIVIPPPNVTGVLHMGHMLNNTIQDVLIRRARMQGKNACWVPGTDHASIATEAKVVAMLKERGISKKELTRPEFLNYAWEWKNKYGGIILDQLKKLGASCDWDRTSFTMDESLSEAVIDSFIHLYKKGWIYRGVRMVNWDPQGKTAVSDEEVIRKEVNQKLYYIRYNIVGDQVSVAGDGGAEHASPITRHTLTIATTRPETIMADSAICINPNDERYRGLHGRRVLIPLINREIPVILDEYVAMDFGTGCLKVTPAHDLNDYELGLKHHLPVIDILNDDGTLNSNAQILVGEDRFTARKKIARLLEDAGALEKVEDNKSQVGFSERTDAVIEPKLSMQWFCKMQEMVKPALADVLDGEVKLIPEKFVNTYRHWMENVRDWCISRQLWWGQQIPAWYLPDGQFVVARTRQEAYEEARKIQSRTTDLQPQDLRQDEDVVDTWFSSWLWPISVFDGFRDPNNADINYYYPTNDLVTAPEILFFWVARMIMAGHEFRNEKPFTNVYLTGIVRDKLGRKMSKSLGNSPDPLDLMKKYSADGVRVGMLLSSPAGNDLMFDEKDCEQGRNFANKIWNAFRLVKGWEVKDNPQQTAANDIAVQWFNNRFNQALADIDENFKQYRLSEALMATYKLVWDDFCAWYLEMIKPAYQQPIDTATYRLTAGFFENLLKLLHPFMPFITEELWHDEVFGERAPDDCCIVAQLPAIEQVNTRLLAEVEMVKQLITEVRNIRNGKQISPKEALTLFVKPTSGTNYLPYAPVIIRLANLSKFDFTQDKVNGAVNFITGNDEFYLLLGDNLDAAAEMERLLKEKEYLTGFLKSVEAKLLNERFVSNAKPEIVDNERKKKADAEAKLRILEEGLNTLAG